MSSTSAYQAGQEVVPGYTLIEPLGSGMAGQVWVARAAGGMKVAVKMVPLRDLGGRKELSALKTIRRGNVRHPNLCPVHGFWLRDAEGRLLAEGETEEAMPDSSLSWIAEEGVGGNGNLPQQTMSADDFQRQAMRRTDNRESKPDGPKPEELIVVMGLGDRSLYARLQEVRKAVGLDDEGSEIDREVVCGLDAPEVIGYLRGAASAIDELHQEFDISHNDIKPQNIVLLGGGVQVCDFGLATRVSGDFRETKAVFASPAYAAPEVLDGAKYSKPGDQYSLAVTYVELRTGVLPFDTTTAFTLQLAKTTGKLKLTHLSQPEEKVLRKAMSVKPEDRYDSCSDFVRALAIATGLEKTGGITPSRLAAGAVLLMLVTGLVIRFVFPPSSLITAETRHTSAKRLLDNYQEISSPSYAVHRQQLRDTLKESVLGFKIADNDFKSNLSRVSLLASAELNELISDRLHSGHPGELVAQVNSDLNYVKSIDAIGVLDENASEHDEIIAETNSSLLQVALLDDKPPPNEAIRQLREFVRSQETPFVVESVVVVLTHHRQNTDFTETLPLHDWLAAEAAIKESGTDELPAWCVSRWNSLRDELLPQIQHALETADLDEADRDKIRRLLPDISLDAEISEIAKLFEQNRWTEARKKLFELARSQPTVRDSVGARKLKVLRRMSDLVGSQQPLGPNIMKIGEEIAAANLPSRELRAATLAAWIAEMSRQIVKSSVTEFGEIESAYRSAKDLLGGHDVPIELARLVVGKSIESGPTTFDSDAVEDGVRILVSQDQKTPVDRFMVSALQVESAAVKGNRELGTESFRALLSDRSVVDALSYLPDVYFDFIRSVLHFHDFQLDEAAERWSGIRRRSASFQSELGPARCAWVAKTLLQLASKKSGVRDEEVLRRRFVESQEGIAEVEEARQWVRGLNQTTRDLAERLAIQTLLIDVAERARQNQPAQIAVPNELRGLTAGKEHDPSYGQLYRALFEIDLASLSEDSLGAFLSTTDGLLEIGLGRFETINIDRAWIDSILAPAMQKFLEFAQPSVQYESGLRFAVKLQLESLITLCQRYLETEYFQVGTEPATHLRGLEVSAAVLASVPTSEKASQVDDWLRAAEFFERRKEIEKANWDREKLRQFATYLVKARGIDPEHLEVKVQWSFASLHQAMLKAREGGDSSTQYEEASTNLEKAIADLKDRFDRTKKGGITLYNAYWRHANLLVNEAFDTPEENAKREILALAIESARQARDLPRSVPRRESRRIKKEFASVVLGNAYEDFAEYSRNTDTSKRPEYFEKARMAFEEAKSFDDSMFIRYHIARCLYRHFKVTRDRKLLRTALASLGEYDHDASLAVKLEWLCWKSQVEFAMGESQAGRLSIADAFRLLEAHEGDIVDRQLRDETILLYVESLMVDTNKQGSMEAAEILEASFDDRKTVHWKSKVLLCEAYFRLEKHAELLEVVESIRDQAIVDSLVKDPVSTTRSIAWIANWMQQRTLPEYMGEPSKLGRLSTRGQTCLLRIRDLLNRESGSLVDSESKAYANFATAIAGTVDSRLIAQHMQDLLDAVSGDAPTLDGQLLDRVRRLMIEQYWHVAFANDSPKVRREGAEIIKRFRGNPLIGKQLRALLQNPIAPQDRNDIKDFLEELGV